MTTETIQQIPLARLSHRIVTLRKYGDRLTCREIAEDLGVPETRVHRVLRDAGLQREYRGMDKRTRAKA